MCAHRAGGLLVLTLILWSVRPSASAEQVFPIEAARGRLVVHVFRKGLLSPALHDHHFVAERWSGRVAIDPERLETPQVEVIIEAASLSDEQPKLSAEDRRTVEAQVRSPRFLDAARYPTIHFVAERFDIESRSAGIPLRLRGVLQGRLTIRGKSAPIGIALEVDLWPDRLRATGTTAFRQSDFGIQPLSRLLGTIGVQDRVRVDVEVEAGAAASGSARRREGHRRSGSGG